MKFFQSKAFKAWVPVLIIIGIAVVAFMLLGASNKAVAPSETASTTPDTQATGTPAAPAAGGSNPASGLGIGAVKSTTYAPTGWSLKFKLEDGWRVQPIRNDDDTVAQVTIGTPMMSMMVLHDKPFGKPARKTPMLSTKTILGAQVEIATYDDTSYFTIRHDGDDYHFSVKGGLDAFIASIQAAG